jgi:outer membrane protein TolC
MTKKDKKGNLPGWTLLFIIGFTSSAMAADNQKTISLSIGEAVEIALKNNLDLKIESYTPEIKQLDLQKIYDGYGFSVGFRPSLQNNVRKTSSSFLTGNTVSKDFSQSYDFFATKKLLSNGEISLNFDNGISSTNSTKTEINPAISPGLSLSFSQPILRNAWNGYRQVSIGKNETYASNLRLKAKAIDVVAQTKDAYWNLVLTRERLKVLEDSLNLTRALLKINQEKEKAGVIAKLEVLSTQATIASSEESLLQGKRSLDESEDALKKILNPSGANIDWDVHINTSGIPEITKVGTDFTNSFNRSLKNRPDYQAVLADKHTINLQAEIANQNRFPELTVNGSVGLNSLDKDYISALGNLFSLQTYNWNFGLNLEIPVIGNVNETTYKQVLLNEEKQDLTIENFKQSMINEVRTAIRNVEINQKRVEANKLSKKLMSEQVKAETEKLNLGMSTNYQVMQLQGDLQQTALNEVNARVEYLKSLDELSRVEGLSLEQNHIIWDNNYNRDDKQEK